MRKVKTAKGKLCRQTRKSEESYEGKRGKVRKFMTTNEEGEKRRQMRKIKKSYDNKRGKVRKVMTTNEDK